jgi:hypothetical protein
MEEQENGVQEEEQEQEGSESGEGAGEAGQEEEVNDGGGQEPAGTEEQADTFNWTPEQKAYIEALQVEKEKAVKRVEDQSKFIDRQGTEIGQLRKSESRLKEIEGLLTEKRRRQDELADSFDVDRGSYDTTITDIAKLENEKTQVAKEYNRLAIKNAVPSYDDLKTKEIVEVLKEDGAMDYEIPAFLDQLETNPALAIQIAKRAEMKRTLNEKLKVQETLKSQTKTTQQKLANASSFSRNTGGSSGARSTYSAQDVKVLSDAELDKRLSEEINRIRR